MLSNSQESQRKKLPRPSKRSKGNLSMMTSEPIAPQPLEKTVAFTTLGCKANQYDTAVLAEQFKRRGFRVIPFEAEADVYVVNSCTVTADADQSARRLLRQAHRRNQDAIKVVTGCYAQVNPEALAQVEGVHYVVGNTHKNQIVEFIETDEQFNKILQLKLEDTAKTSTVIARSSATRQSSGKRFNALDRHASLAITNSSFKDSPLPHSPQVNADLSHVKPKIFSREILKDKEFSTFGVQLYGHRARAFLKIQDGCNQFCSFCIIPFARGQNRSISPERVMDELWALADQGYEEVVLTGIHLGTYGKDLNQNFNLYKLLERIEKERPLNRIRLSSIDPEEVTEDIQDLLLGSSIFCPYLHIPVQSGDNAILSRMRRRYKREDFISLSHALKRKNEKFCIGTDFLIGFPGEDDDAFLNSYRLFDEALIDYAHVFTYSSRDGTKAAEWPDDVPPTVKKSRTHRLRTRSDERQTQFANRFVGDTCHVIWDQPKPDQTLLKGVTPEYLSVQIPFAADWKHDKSLLPRSSYARLLEVKEGYLWGSLC